MTGIHGRQAIPGQDQPVVFRERCRKRAGMPSPVPLQERGLRAIPDGLPLLYHDVADRAAGPGISVDYL